MSVATRSRQVGRDAFGCKVRREGNRAPALGSLRLGKIPTVFPSLPDDHSLNSDRAFLKVQISPLDRQIGNAGINLSALLFVPLHY